MCQYFLSNSKTDVVMVDDQEDSINKLAKVHVYYSIVRCTCDRILRNGFKSHMKYSISSHDISTSQVHIFTSIF